MKADDGMSAEPTPLFGRDQIGQERPGWAIHSYRANVRNGSKADIRADVRYGWKTDNRLLFISSCCFESGKVKLKHGWMNGSNELNAAHETLQPTNIRFECVQPLELDPELVT